MWTATQHFFTGDFHIDWRHLLRRKPKTAPVATIPHFSSPECTRWFIDALKASKLYLEYGAGGSTYHAAQYGRFFISIESDKRFLRAVRKRIARDGYLNAAHQEYVHANIGPTKKWGRPAAFLPPGPNRRDQFAHYSDYPPGLTASGVTPDLILIDGRFRVACALKALRALATHSGWTLVFDDYTDRDHYHAVEKIIPISETVGHMAIFRPSGAIDLEKTDKLIARYEQDDR